MDFSELAEFYKKIGGDFREFKKIPAQLDVGFKFSYSKRISEADVSLFGLISGDMNPIHFDDSFAKQTKFAGRVVHGMLTTSFVSTAVAMLPGIVVLLETNFNYLAPVRIGDVVNVECEIAEKERNRYKVRVECKVGERKVVDGWVRILIW